MKTISNSEFLAHPEKYLDMAVEQNIRIQKGREMFYLTCEPSVGEQPILEPDDDLRGAITGEELLAGIYSDLETFFADKR